jgi:hypothetical protein
LHHKRNLNLFAFLWLVYFRLDRHISWQCLLSVGVSVAEVFCMCMPLHVSSS